MNSYQFAIVVLVELLIMTNWLWFVTFYNYRQEVKRIKDES